MSILDASNIVGFTKPPHGSLLWFTNDMSVRKYSEIVATSTFGNSTSETTLGSFSVPALSLTNQGGVRSFMSGTIRDDTVASQSVRVRTKFIISGSTTTIAESSAIGLNASTAPRDWTSQVVLLGTTLSTQLRSYHYVSVSAPSTGVTHAQNYVGEGSLVFTVPNSSASGTIQTTFQFSTATTDIGAAVQLGTLETLA